MTAKTLKDDALSVFCETIALLHSFGVQTDEAVRILSATVRSARLKAACDQVYASLIKGRRFATSLQDAQAFPPFFIEVVQAGERVGRLEKTLDNLAKYYSREDLLYRRARASLFNQAIAATMATIVLLAVTVVFLSGGSFALGSPPAIACWVALSAEILCGALTAVMGVAAFSMDGWQRLARLLGRVPLMREPFFQMAAGRFVSALDVCLAADIDGDDAFRRATGQVGPGRLRVRLERICRDANGRLPEKDIFQAIADILAISPSHVSLLAALTRPSRLESALGALSSALFDDSLRYVDAVMGCMKSSLTALTAIGAGSLLIAITLQLASLAGTVG